MSPTLVQRTEWSPRTLGRVIGVLLLVTILLGVVAQVVISERLIALRDPARTAANILANETLYRTGFTL